MLYKALLILLFLALLVKYTFTGSAKNAVINPAKTDINVFEYSQLAAIVGGGGGAIAIQHFWA